MDLISKDQTRHDFINNCIRIEILNKMICESIEKNESIEKEHLDDLEKFTHEQSYLLEFVKKYYL